MPVTTEPAAFKKLPTPSVFITKVSPPTALPIVIPTEGLKAFAPPREEVPTKNGVPKVTSKPLTLLKYACGAVETPLPV